MRSSGVYAGTLRPERPWYSRGVTFDGFPDKGPGEYWYDYKGFYFVRRDRDGPCHPRGVAHRSDARSLARHLLFPDEDTEAAVEERGREAKLRFRGQGPGAGEAGPHYHRMGLDDGDVIRRLSVRTFL